MSRSRGKFVVFGIVFLLIAAACAAPTPVPPTLIPPTLAPTPVPPTPVPPTLVPTPVPPTPVPPTPAPTPDLLVPIQAFQDTYNQRDIEGFLALFVEEPSWNLMTAGRGLQLVRNTAELMFEINAQMEANDCTIKNDQVTCVLVLKDDCNTPSVGGGHVPTQFTFVEGKIATVSAGRTDASFDNANAAYDASRMAWARLELPEDAALYNDVNEWTKLQGTGEQGLGHLSASEYGQVWERICRGYTESGN